MEEEEARISLDRIKTLVSLYQLRTPKLVLAWQARQSCSFVSSSGETVNVPQRHWVIFDSTGSHIRVLPNNRFRLTYKAIE